MKITAELSHEYLERQDEETREMLVRLITNPEKFIEFFSEVASKVRENRKYGDFNSTEECELKIWKEVEELFREIGVVFYGGQK